MCPVFIWLFANLSCQRGNLKEHWPCLTHFYFNLLQAHCMLNKSCLIDVRESMQISLALNTLKHLYTVWCVSVLGSYLKLCRHSSGLLWVSLYLSATLWQVGKVHTFLSSKFNSTQHAVACATVWRHVFTYNTHEIVHAQMEPRVEFQGLTTFYIMSWNRAQLTIVGNGTPEMLLFILISFYFFLIHQPGI